MLLASGTWNRVTGVCFSRQALRHCRFGIIDATVVSNPPKDNPDTEVWFLSTLKFGSEVVAAFDCKENKRCASKVTAQRAAFMCFQQDKGRIGV